jgi:integrase/recombinase XerD
MVWPDEEELLLTEFVEQLQLRSTGAPYRSLLRAFQRFVSRQTQGRKLTQATMAAWFHEQLKELPLRLAVHYGHFITRFLDWLAERGAITSNPIAELRQKYECRSTAAVMRALAGPRPTQALAALRPLPRYGSHLGALMREHVGRMRTLGFRYSHENCFLRFDRFLQQRPGAAQETLSTLIHEYAALASSAAGKLGRLKLGSVLAKALTRSGFATVAPARDRMLVQQAVRKRCKPYIYTPEEVRRLLETARRYPSPKAPLRPLTLYTMLLLGYCAGLRIGEIVGLELKDVDLDDATIEIRDTKFFKSRRLPLSSSALTALREYLEARRKAGASADPDAPLFCHEKGGYSYVAAEGLLRRVIHNAGLRPKIGRGGPRIHDLRHTFVVHRMTTWYREGINPQSRLPHLAAYLGHRDIHSTLIYLTITQELLQHANERFRRTQTDVLDVIRRKS